MDEKAMKDLVQRVKSKVRITKVVATRSVKGKSGDFFAGFSGGYESLQEEGAGPGKDLIDVVDTADVANQGMSLVEARVAFYLVAMQTDISAHEAALASGALSLYACTDSVKAIRSNYNKLIRMALMDKDEDAASK